MIWYKIEKLFIVDNIQQQLITRMFSSHTTSQSKHAGAFVCETHEVGVSTVPVGEGGGASAGASAKHAITTDKQSEYYNFIDNEMKETINPFNYTTTYKGETITVYYLIRMNPDCPKIRNHANKIGELVHTEWKCKYCKKYTSAVSLLFDKEGPIIFRGLKHDIHSTCSHSHTGDEHMRITARKEAYKMWKYANSPVKPWDANGDYTCDDRIYTWYPVILDRCCYPEKGGINSQFERNLFKRDCYSGTSETGKRYKHYTYCQPAVPPISKSTCLAIFILGKRCW